MKLLALLVAAVAAGAASASPQAEEVTLSLRQYKNANKVRVVVWYGQIASGATGEDVEILGRDCGSTFFRQLIATRTLTGGGYEVESQSSVPPYTSVNVGPGTTFRARWRDELSNAVTWRVPFEAISAQRIAGRRAWKVYVNPATIDWAGRPVELQRRSGGKWVQYKRQRLTRKPSLKLGAYNHEAVFEVPARGLTLRAFLPAKSVAPCYLTGASDTWRS